MREIGVADNSLNESAKKSLKTCDLSHNNLQLEYNNFLGKYVKVTKEVFYAVGLSDRIGLKDEFFKDYLVFNTRRRGELEIG